MKLTQNLKSVIHSGPDSPSFSHTAQRVPLLPSSFFPCSCQSCNFSSDFPSALHKSLSPFFLFSVKLSKTCRLCLSFNAEGCCGQSMPGPCCHSNDILCYFGGEQVQIQTIGVKHQGRKLAVGQSAAKWCSRYREAKTGWISWAPRYTLKPGQSQRHWDTAAKRRTSVIKRKALSLSGFQRLNKTDAWGMQTSFFGCKFVSFLLGMTSEIFRALYEGNSVKKKKKVPFEWIIWTEVK